ncbi:glycosyltransferase family 4 protein [Saccharopolyspora griseoalba]|uniref:Glycosyltransferase family 4 protein n=1 Tax=Saccharopolyspora griseoalba TaxID=1431848 RepID=A0ABW2LK70_9PSEU
MARALDFLVPDDVDDPMRPSGGNAYDRRLRDGLRAAGCPVRQVGVAGERAAAELARALAEIPDGGAVLVDGLLADAAPQELLPHTARLDVVPLVHVPPGEERGTAVHPDVRALLAAARAVVVTSRWTGERLREHGVDAASLVLARPGVDRAPLAAGTDGATSLLAVGSLTPAKGQDVLADSLARLAELPWTCRMVGPRSRDPGFAGELRRAITASGLAGRIGLRGPQGTADLEATYARADLVVVPSRTEAYGMVATEALARGIPVLATRTGGTGEALGEAAMPELLAEPGDPAALADALRRWLEDPGLRAEARRRAGARRATLPTWTTAVAAVGAVLRRLLEPETGEARGAPSAANPRRAREEPR